jgi:hypothetical protein
VTLLNKTITEIRQGIRTAPTNAKINRLQDAFRPTQIYEEKEWHGISSHHFTQRTRGVDVFVSVALAVTETPSSSGMGRKAPFGTTLGRQLVVESTRRRSLPSKLSTGLQLPP